MSIAWAFLRRDLWIQTSYRFAFVQMLLSVFFATALYFFLGHLVTQAPEIDAAGGSYFGFVIVGLVVTTFLNASIFQIAQVFRTEQTLGTLEALLSAPVSLPVVLVGSSLWTFALAALEALAYLACALLMGVDLHRANWPAGVLVMLLAVICFAGLGVAEAGLGIVLKQGNPLGWIFSTLSALIGGAYFPPSLLPDWLRWLSVLHPLTYATQGLREALLNGASFSLLLPRIGALAAFSLLTVPLGLVGFSLAVRHARREGSLAHI